jgi:hypothetical protein
MSEGNQESARGEVQAVKLSAERVARRQSMPVRVEFLQDTVHPDYGSIEKGEVLQVAAAYAEQYEDLGIATFSDKALSRRVAETT